MRFLSQDLRLRERAQNDVSAVGKNGRDKPFDHVRHHGDNTLQMRHD
jgi:hypothetical protein